MRWMGTIMVLWTTILLAMISSLAVWLLYCFCMKDEIPCRKEMRVEGRRGYYCQRMGGELTRRLRKESHRLIASP